MKTRKKRNNAHRTVWRRHNGPIPKDEFGLAHEIHHIDGDHTNNDIANLVCLTLHEHFEIHFWQEDWKACAVMMGKLCMSIEEISEMHSRIRGSLHPKYDHAIHSFTHRQTKETVMMTSYDFARAYNCIPSHVARVAHGKRWTMNDWALTKNIAFLDQRDAPKIKPPPKDRKVTASRGDKHYRYDHTIYEFKHRDTQESFSGTQSEIVKTFNLNCSHVSMLVKKQVITAKGWMLAENFGKNIVRPYAFAPSQKYRWSNTATGEIIEATRNHMAKTYGLGLSHLLSIIKGDRQSHKGWTLMK